MDYKNYVLPFAVNNYGWKLFIQGDLGSAFQWRGGEVQKGGCKVDAEGELEETFVTRLLWWRHQHRHYGSPGFTVTLDNNWVAKLVVVF